MAKVKSNPLPAVYDSFLQELKVRIRSAQVRAALSVNREQALLRQFSLAIAAKRLRGRCLLVRFF